MKSIKFPNMFGTSGTKVWEESEYRKATAQNLKLSLLSMRGHLLGDPYFGISLQQFMFEPNNYILRDQLVDTIYTQIAIFIPQLRVQRKDIKIIQDKRKACCYCQIYGINNFDYTPNSFELLLFSSDEKTV